MKGLVLFVDWQNERFALTGTADLTAESDDGPRRVVTRASGDGPSFGLRAMPASDGTIQVAGTEPGSQAEAIGLLAGDRIVAFNGKSAQGIEISAVRAELARPDLVLTVERDGERLKLERVPTSGG